MADASVAPIQDTLGQNPRLQSPHVYLQGAGSDGSDGTSAGIHLRWAFQRMLGDLHLPKGDAAAPGGSYPTTRFYNRAGDYVRIAKTSYDPTLFSITVRLDKPASIAESGALRRWRYGGFRPISEDPSILTEVEVRFSDIGLYDIIRASVDPHTDAIEFLRRYEGTIEVEALGKHLLNICVLFEPFRLEPSYRGPLAWGEAVSTRNRIAPPDPYLACRSAIEFGKSTRLCFTCEDTRHIRFRYHNSYPVAIELQTYEDYTVGVFLRTSISWRTVGFFSLSLDDGRAFAALANAPSNDVDGRWPKFNEADPATGAFAVQTKNYMDRWSRPDGIRAAVDRYFDLSRFDAKATALLTDPSTQPNEAAIDMSYLDALKIAAQDFHVARMLGLGHIDSAQRTVDEKTVYLLEYVTEAALETFAPATHVTHYYMTPPVTRTTYRLPARPVLRAPRYGLWHKSIENEPAHLLTDPDGYTRYEPSRWINLDRDPFEFDGALPEFWSRNPIYCLCTSSIPAMYGVEYRKLGEPGWRRPEISHDRQYQDNAGLWETAGALELGQNPVFTHREMEEGIHQYALYSINWFSRVSPLSNIVATDDTRFPVLRALKPPANFAVQLVQPENPLIFTTSVEQAMLGTMPDPDKTLVRVTFEWDQVHQIAYQFADLVEFFFREKLPESILGQISTAAGSITSASDHRVRVRTAPQIVTPSPPLVRQPFLPPAQEARYVGGNFVCSGRLYVIDEIEFPSASGTNPTFVVRQVRQTSMVEGLEPNELITQETWVGPSPPGEPFMAVENVNRAENWDSQLARTVYIEPFHETWRLRVSGSAQNDRDYTLHDMALVGPDTRLTVREDLASDLAPFGNLVYRRRARVSAANPADAELTVAGDLASGPGGLSPGMTVRVFGSPENAGSYNVAMVNVVGGQTIVRIAPPPASAVASGYLDYDKNIPVTAVDRANQHFFVAGNLTAQLRPPRIEQHAQPDGKIVEYVIGGLTGSASVSDIPDGAAPRSGAFEIVFDTLTLPDHVDPGIEWYRGTIRVFEDAALFPPPADPTYRAPQQKVLNIWAIDRTGATARLVAFDPTFDSSFDPAAGPVNPQTGYVPIATGAGIEVNVHPGYRLYLLADMSGGSNFTQSSILPAAGGGSKKTVLAARSVDTSIPATYSPLTPPAVLVAQEIREPVPPGVPTGPLFATRPDFYGKATYTFDVAVGAPYALVFYRGTDRGILDALYKPATTAQIIADLAALESPDADFANDRWRDLASGVTDGTDRFPQYLPGGYRFPTPDNDRYVLPNENPAVRVKPFLSGTLPGQIIDSVRRAIEGSFVPLAEQPLVYAQLASGSVTSGRPPVVRDISGQRLAPGNADPWPMAVRLPDGKVRFTDYALDGAATNQYFYFGIELSNRMQRSERGPIAGPVMLVNSSPPVAPVIRDLRVRTANPVMGLRAAVVFEVNPYLPVDNVASFRIYRANDASAARSVRGMQLVRTVAGTEEPLDGFEDVETPPFGDTLYYRIVALRRFTNEQGEEEFAPSWPSDARRVQLIDDIVPPAPELTVSFGIPLPGPFVQLPDVTLNWTRTAWNPRYHVYKMNVRGNWMKVHTVESNAASVSLDLASTELGTNVLPKQNIDGRTIYHRFKVVTENSSGLLSREEKPLVI